MDAIKTKVILPQQWLHMGAAKLEKEKFIEVKNRPCRNKPKGGLWIAPYKKGKPFLSDWHEELYEVGFPQPEEGVLVTLKEDARVCVIDSQDDLIRIINQFPVPVFPGMEDLYEAFPEDFIDYERMRQAYDVLYLTKKGEWETRSMLENARYNLWGWDCSSAIVLNYDILQTQQPIQIK